MGGGLTVLGIVHAAHYGSYGWLILGLAVVIATATLWWLDVLKESRTPGLHSPVVRLGLRYGMTLFITSEVMFFVGFFWAFFHFALFPEHVLDVTGPAVWPPAGIETFDPFHLPFLNTMILLLSGCTVTWAHHALIEGDRRGLIMGLGITVLLGMSFTGFQVMEYSEAPFKFSGGGVYPAVFFLATGFHGAHVIIGTIFLTVCWFRAKAGQFTPQRHFGFEGRGLVLALRGRGVAVPVRCRVLVGGRDHGHGVACPATTARTSCASACCAVAPDAGWGGCMTGF